MNAYTTLSGKGQVVIPKDVRDRLRLAPGDRLDVVERPDGVLLRRTVAPDGDGFDEITARIRNRVKYRGPVVSVEEMNGAISKLWTSSGPRWDK
ncbi:AbrB/MazE/SpoVT family DNA-binding domain-containing protein [Sphingomonas sp.]|uniref:AbrB/MazE/SpoVT family DNA-binding domain-containing protein n=1 Tax=Sphingomonas sp. TaxID=28214 RepID=UPI003B00CA3F